MGLWDRLCQVLSERKPQPPPSGLSAFDLQATVDVDAAGGPVEPVADLLAVERPPSNPVAEVVEHLLVQQFDGHDLTLPPLPQVPERVLRLLGDPNCSMARVADAIAGDQVVAASILRGANSPLYRGAHEITSLHQAVTRLGVNALRTLMMHQALRAATFLKRGSDRHLAETIWQRSIASAQIMYGLSRFASIDANEAWLMGLLHDVGNVIVLRVLQEHTALTGQQVGGDWFEYLCYESHQEFGELIADAWNMPPDLKAIVSSHHTYPAEDDPLRTERLMLRMTDMIASRLGYAPRVAYNLLTCRAAVALGLPGRYDVVSFLEDLPEQIENAIMHF